MNIFVTGSTGYIGSAVAAAFRRAGHRVFGLVRSSEKARALAQEEIVPVLGDLAAPESFLAVARGCDVFVHCASEYSSATVARDRAAIDTFFAAAARCQCAAGTDLHVGRLGVRRHRRPNSRRRPRRSTLSISRAGGSSMSRWSSRRRVASCGRIVLRPGCVYGGSGGLTVPWFASAVAGEVEMVGDGSNCWSTVHVDDVAEAYVLAAERAPGRRGAEHQRRRNPRVGEMVAAVAAAAGIPGRITQLSPGRRGRALRPASPKAWASHQKVANVRAKAALGWHPRHASFVSEADLYFAAYRAHQG
jgi:nucleoside-diphosphate-sugar epimerase